MVGLSVGLAVGCLDGLAVTGELVGFRVGFAVGFAVGCFDGVEVSGVAVGSVTVGNLVGVVDG